MAKNANCVVPECDNKAHAKGYCRKHYGQIWRKGKIYSEKEVFEVTENVEQKDDTDRMRALERELKRAQMMYRNVIGFEGRLKWRREIDEVKKEMCRLGMEPDKMLEAVIN